MAKYSIPGAAVAVARDGRLVVVRAYGVADRERQIATQPDSLFRVGSISKTVTAAAVVNLVEEGRLDLDSKVFSILSHLQPPTGATPDPRLRDITVRQILQHTGGWDRELSGDPIGMGPSAARALKVPAPVTAEQLIRYMMGQRLDFDPGTRFAYSNLGFVLLGRIIEAVTHMPYEDYVKLAVLSPIGIRRMRIGRGTLAGRADGEVKYYDMPGAPLVWTQLRGTDPIVPLPYAQPIEMWDSCGAWIASAVDLVRFADLLAPHRLQRMLRDRVPMPPGTAKFYGLGVFIGSSDDGGEPAWWHAGALAGTAAVMVHRPDGITYAVLFNSGPWTDSYGDMCGVGDAHNAIKAAIDSIREWPEIDLFQQFQ